MSIHIVFPRWVATPRESQTTKTFFWSSPCLRRKQSGLCNRQHNKENRLKAVVLAGRGAEGGVVSFGFGARYVGEYLKVEPPDGWRSWRSGRRRDLRSRLASSFPIMARIAGSLSFSPELFGLSGDTGALSAAASGPATIAMSSAFSANGSTRNVLFDHFNDRRQ